MSELKFDVEGQSESQTRISVKARQFSLTIDEPPILGGDDLGANPVEYLLASYAGCVNVLAYLIANELSIKLNKLTIKIDGNINTDRLFGRSFAERAGFKQINLYLKPDTNASPELLKKWASEIKNRCPINDNLLNPTPITFQIS
jgi:uncharacterized OsmC-like protein